MPSNSNNRPVDTGLACFIMVTRVYQVARDLAQIRHQFGTHDKPLDETPLIRAIRHLRLKAKAVTAFVDKIDKLALSAIDENKNDDFYFVA